MSQYSYRSCSGLMWQYLRIMREYDLATTIKIRPLINSHTCGTGLSIFYSMGRLKLSSTTRTFFPRMSSTEITKGKKYFCFSWECLPWLSLFCLSQQARRVVGVCVRVSKSDVDHGISLAFPYASNENVNYCIQSAIPLTYLLLLYAADLVDERLAAYAVRREGSLNEVKEIVTHIIVTYDDEASVDASKSVAYKKGHIKAVTF